MEIDIASSALVVDSRAEQRNARVLAEYAGDLFAQDLALAFGQSRGVTSSKTVDALLLHRRNNRARQVLLAY